VAVKIPELVGESSVAWIFCNECIDAGAVEKEII
jgi:hypothetical protein